ncbi:MAG TPA: hypothetical protein VHF01_18745, partial [Candidatus Acidoferrum sp.]|nr:hypothetical protein [Candidatus Acidoferrum sp.]
KHRESIRKTGHLLLSLLVRTGGRRPNLPVCRPSEAQHALGIGVEYPLLDIVRIAEFIPLSEQAAVRKARIIAAEQDLLLKPASNVHL